MSHLALVVGCRLQVLLTPTQPLVDLHMVSNTYTEGSNNIMV